MGMSKLYYKSNIQYCKVMFEIGKVSSLLYTDMAVLPDKALAVMFMNFNLCIVVLFHQKIFFIKYI